MRRHSLRPVSLGLYQAAATLLTSLACSLGCGGKQCVTVTDHGTSDADLSGMSNDPISPDGGDAESQTRFHVISVTTSLSIANRAHCLSVGFAAGKGGFGIDMQCPAGPGTFRIEDLGATLCEGTAGVGGGGCTAVNGTLTVRAITLPCDAAGTTCGRLDADLDVTTSTGPAPRVGGTATLAFSESLVVASCPSYSLPE